MQNATNLPEQLAYYLYKLVDIQHIHTKSSRFQQETNLHGMLLFTKAKGDILIEGRIFPLHQQKVFLLTPGVSVELRLPTDDSVEYTYIRFHALEAAHQGHFAPAKLQGLREVTVTHFPFLLVQVDEIQRKHHSGNAWESMKANILFQEMLVVLFQDVIQEPKQDLDQAIALTVDYMKQHYRLEITREKLAEMAGLSADYYSRAFKKIIGKSPMEYLNDIRINQAKQMLLQSHGSFRTIAQRVGFNDEFYFSRRFKATTGCSPTIYVKQFKQSSKIASLKNLLTGHLIALGIEPYAAVMNDAFPIAHRFRNTIVVGNPIPDLERLLSAKPDLIVTCGSRDVDKSLKEKMFDQIAPTVTLPFFHNWRVHFQTIANVVGKEKEANDWLERYERKADLTRKQVEQKIGNETVLILGVGKGKMCVYGQRNLGTVLYGDLKVSPPKGVAEIAHYKELSLDALSDFDADRIVLTCFKHDGTVQTDEAIRKEVHRLFNESQWQALKAVQNRSVHCMYESRHLYTSYNPLSHDLLLDHVQYMLMSESSK